MVTSIQGSDLPVNNVEQCVCGVLITYVNIFIMHAHNFVHCQF